MGVRKRYGERHALLGVDLVARRGEVHGLLGPNGAGKTTLLRVVLGLVRPDAGTVHLLGHEVSSAARQPVPNGVAGFVEAPTFYPYLSGRSNLELLARIDSDPSSAANRIGGLLERVGLAAHENVRVSGYSAGMRQRLGLAAALIRSPSLLLLDEPTSTLDPAGARDIRSEVRRLADEGAAVVLSSHDMGEVENLCASLTIIHRGRVVFSGAIEALRKIAPDAVYLLRTSDDRAAIALATPLEDIRVSTAPAEDGLEVCGAVAALDRLVIVLGRADIAVRGLERRTPSLEALFLELTAHSGGDGGAHAGRSRDSESTRPALEGGS
jgi:ABC-2 type transport system ATP-binding protein